jgi:hypothetical protein
LSFAAHITEARAIAARLQTEGHVGARATEFVQQQMTALPERPDGTTLANLHARLVDLHPFHQAEGPREIGFGLSIADSLTGAMQSNAGAQEQLQRYAMEWQRRHFPFADDEVQRVRSALDAGSADAEIAAMMNSIQWQPSIDTLVSHVSDLARVRRQATRLGYLPAAPGLAALNAVRDITRHLPHSETQPELTGKVRDLARLSEQRIKGDSAGERGHSNYSEIGELRSAIQLLAELEAPAAVIP